MFERFSLEAREVVVRAQYEADRLGHSYIGTEHLLLGIVGGEGKAGSALRSLGVSSDDLRAQLQSFLGDGPRLRDADALAAIGIDLEKVRRRVEASFGPGALDRTRAGRRFCRGRPFVPRAKKVLELSLYEARDRGDDCIGSEHVLLGILREGNGVAVKLLEEQGLSPELVRATVLREPSGT